MLVETTAFQIWLFLGTQCRKHSQSPNLPEF